MTAAFRIENTVSLARHTTLGLGGRARHFVEAHDEPTAVAVADWAKQRGAALLVLGGGSNMVVADAGFDGVVLRLALGGVRFESEGDRVLVHAAAGESWDQLVTTAVGRDLGGVECLAGIPGLVGATPIQNVGAYGQEVSDTIRTLRALDRTTGQIVDLPAAACDFGYRHSMFKRRPDAYVVLGVTFALRPGAAPCLRYRELEASVGAGGRAPTLAQVSATVRALRKNKSMLTDPTDPNRRSVGSFFTNPVLVAGDAARVCDRAVAAGAAGAPSDVPQWAAPDGRIKLSAGWLVEHAGFPKGWRRGAFGVSSNHALALVHHGSGSTAELLALARDIRDAVRSRFGATLDPEPTLVGATWS